MQAYKDNSGDSGVAGFKIAAGSITIAFKNGGVYLYNSRKPGTKAVETMKKLALSGDGLATYINKYVRQNFAARLQ